MSEVLVSAEESARAAARAVLDAAERLNAALELAAQRGCNVYVALHRKWEAGGPRYGTPFVVAEVLLPDRGNGGREGSR